MLNEVDIQSYHIVGLALRALNMAGNKDNHSVVKLNTGGSATKRRAGGTRQPAKDISEFTSRAERIEFYLPVTGFVWFYPEEIAVVNHPAFQRLGRINQLGQAFLVFRSATHKRLEHVLGAVQVAQRMIAAVSHNQKKIQTRGEYASAQLEERETRFIRLAVLLHDIGHLPAGHTIEDELGLVGAHDADPRLTYVFDRKGTEFGASTESTLAEVIEENYAHIVPPRLHEAGMTPSMIARLIIRKRPPTGADDLFKDEEAILSSSREIRLDVCRNMVGNTICADLLDYLYRDWYHIGKPRTFEDRILQYMEIRNASAQLDRKVTAKENDRRHSSDQFVISLGKSPKIRTDGVSAILSLLEWRYELAEIVLFHRVKCTAAAMLDRALFELWENVSGDDIVKTIFQMSDEQLLDECVILAKSELDAHPSDARRVALQVSISQLQRLKNRELFKELWTRTLDQIGPGQLQPLKRTYGGEGITNREAAANRASVVRLLEQDFCLRPGSIAIYCAEAKAKIAEVAIAVEDEIAPFHDYEQTNGARLSGGHLIAQVNRFKNLWRIQLFIEREERERLRAEGNLDTLVNAVGAVLLPEGSAAARADRIRSFALRLAEDSNLPYASQILLRTPLVEGALAYPSGVPTIRAFFAGPDGRQRNA